MPEAVAQAMVQFRFFTSLPAADRALERDAAAVLDQSGNGKWKLMNSLADGREDRVGDSGTDRRDSGLAYSAG